MTCGDKFNKNCPTGGTRVAPEEVPGRLFCRNPRCGRLLQDGGCPRGCPQTGPRTLFYEAQENLVEGGKEVQRLGIELQSQTPGLEQALGALETAQARYAEKVAERAEARHNGNPPAALTRRIVQRVGEQLDYLGLRVQHCRVHAGQYEGCVGTYPHLEPEPEEVVQHIAELADSLDYAVRPAYENGLFWARVEGTVTGADVDRQLEDFGRVTGAIRQQTTALRRWATVLHRELRAEVGPHVERLSTPADWQAQAEQVLARYRQGDNPEPLDERQQQMLGDIPTAGDTAALARFYAYSEQQRRARGWADKAQEVPERAQETLGRAVRQLRLTPYQAVQAELATQMSQAAEALLMCESPDRPIRQHLGDLADRALGLVEGTTDAEVGEVAQLHANFLAAVRRMHGPRDPGLDDRTHHAEALVTLSAVPQPLAAALRSADTAAAMELGVDDVGRPALYVGRVGQPPLASIHPTWLAADHVLAPSQRGWEVRWADSFDLAEPVAASGDLEGMVAEIATRLRQ